MQTNKTKAKLKAGEVVIGSELNFPCPDMVEMLGYAGADYVYIDTEHSATTYESIAHMIRAAEGSGATPLVRIPENLPDQYPSYIMRLLDIGAMGIIVPHVSTKAVAQAVVDSVKYPPEGKRGAATGRMSGYGLHMSKTEYSKKANEETLVVIMIESAEAVDNLSDILSVKGIDVVQIGTNDLAQSMGYTGKFTEPAVLKALDKIIIETLKAGAAVGVGSLDGFPQMEEKINEFLDDGVQFMNINARKLIISGIKQWQERVLNYKQRK